MRRPVYLSLCESFFPDSPGGMGRVAWDCARQFRAAGYDVHMACLTDDADSEIALRQVEGVHVHTLRRPRYHALNPLRLRLTLRHLAAFVGRCAAEAGPDIVHAHSVFMGHAATVAIGGRAPLFFTVHSPVTHEQSLNWGQAGLEGWIKATFGLRSLARLERDLLRHAAVVHCLSQYTRTLLASDHGAGFEATVIPHWTDETWRSSRPRPEARALLGLPAQGPIFFSVRQMRHRYGIDTAIAAARQVAIDPGAVLVLAGSGPDARKLRALAGSDAAGGRILFTGRVSDEQLHLLYEAADYFLLPTRALECFGLIILEAYGHGLPVLATRVAAIPELVGQVSPDWLVPPDDPAAMARAMAAIVRGTLPAPSAETLVAFAHGTYGRERVFPRYLEAVDRVLARRS